MKSEFASRERTWMDTYVGVLFKLRYLFVAGYIVLLGFAISYGKDAYNVLENEGFYDPKSESFVIQQIMNDPVTGVFYPDYTLVFLVESSDGSTYQSPSFQDKYNTIVTNLKTLPVIGVVNYFENPKQIRMVNDDGTKVLIFATIAGELTNKLLQTTTAVTDLKVSVGGPVPWGFQMKDDIDYGIQIAEYSSMPFLFVSLILVLGGLVIGLIPWFVACGGIFCTLSILVYFSSTHRISIIAATITTMFGLGLGIDYSLIVLTRFRDDRNLYPNLHVTEILKRTLQTSGRTVMFSAVIVSCSLAGGLFFDEYYLCSICLAVMLSSLASAICANTFLVALLAIVDSNINAFPTPSFTRLFARIRGSSGDWIVGFGNQDSALTERFIESKEAVAEKNYEEDAITMANRHNPAVDHGFWYDIGMRVVEHPISFATACTLFLVGFTCAFFVILRFGVTDPDVLPLNAQPRYVYDQMQSDFYLLGQTNLYVFLHTKPAYPVIGADFLNELASYRDVVLARAGDAIASSTSMVSQSSCYLPGDQICAQQDFISQYRFGPCNGQCVALAYPIGLTDFASHTYITFSLNNQIYSDAAKDTLLQVRDALKTAFTVNGEYILEDDSGVTGDPALFHDLYVSFNGALPKFLSIMLCSVFLILVIMTKSLLLPIKAVFMTVLSLGASFGIIVLLFTSKVVIGFTPSATGTIDANNLIFILAISFGLSIDYELFLLSYILEEYRRTKNAKLSVVRAMSRTGRLISSAAFMLAITTFGFISSTLSFIKLIGVGISIAVVLDATLIRMIYVPATIILLGDYNWYCPKWLSWLIEGIGTHDGSHTDEEMAAMELEASRDKKIDEIDT